VPSRNTLEDRIRALEARLLEPEVRASPAELERLLADDFLEFGSSGRVYGRRDVIDALPGRSEARFTLEELRVRPLGPGVVLATYRLLRAATPPEAARSSLRSSIWRREGKRWRLAFHQGTPIGATSRGRRESPDSLRRKGARLGAGGGRDDGGRMSEEARGQVSRSAAQVYDEFFVPALFEGWAARVAEAAAILPGQRVLDVACGTGALTREVAARVAPAGSVVGLDPNDGMLAVARRREPGIEWRKGAAEALPFDDESFDAVVSQFGLMFFADRSGALREMRRVLRPGGHLAVAVWAPLESSPGYAALADLLRRLFGDAAAEALHALFALGDRESLLRLFAEAGLGDARATTLRGTACFPSLESWLFTEVRGWVLADALDDAQYARLVASARDRLSAFEAPDGRVAFAAPAHIVTATRG